MSPKCIIILSTKSSGSSACQKFLTSNGRVKHAHGTGHSENETLYWTKAASVLGLPQMKLVDSEIPIERSRARAELTRLLSRNIDSYSPADDDEVLVFDGWRRLCLRYAPVFLEKSPHHLNQWSNLELIRRAIESLPEIEFHIVGLVRNPMDTLYSAWCRWRTDPQTNQYQWLVAYGNLLRLKHLLGEQVNVVRYEDLVSSPGALARELAFAGIDDRGLPQRYFHRNAVSKWRKDKLFGFRLADEVIDLGLQLGYSLESMTNPKRLMWRPYKALARAEHRTRRSVTSAARNVRRLLPRSGNGLDWHEDLRSR